MLDKHQQDTFRPLRELTGTTARVRNVYFQGRVLGPERTKRARIQVRIACGLQLESEVNMTSRRSDPVLRNRCLQSCYNIDIWIDRRPTNLSLCRLNRTTLLQL